MSQFNELSLRFAEYRTARLDQLRRLTTQAQHFKLALEDYLDLPAETWINSTDGIEMAYVRLGKGQPQNFEEKGTHEFSSLDGRVDFSVSVTLERGPGLFPKTHHVFQLTVAALKGGYEFTSKDFDGSFRVATGEESFHAYEQLCAALVNKLKDGYDVNQVL